MTDKIFGPLSFMSPSLQFNVACCSRNGHPQAALFEGGTGLSSSLLDMKFTLFLFVILNLEGRVQATFATHWRKKPKKTPKPCYPKDINISSK